MEETQFVVDLKCFEMEANEFMENVRQADILHKPKTKVDSNKFNRKDKLNDKRKVSIYLSVRKIVESGYRQNLLKLSNISNLQLSNNDLMYEWNCYIMNIRDVLIFENHIPKTDNEWINAIVRQYDSNLYHGIYG